MMEVDENAIYLYGNQFAEHLANGLADNWSQVRKPIHAHCFIKYHIFFFSSSHARSVNKKYILGEVSFICSSQEVLTGIVRR